MPESKDELEQALLEAAVEAVDLETARHIDAAYPAGVDVALSNVVATWVHGASLPAAGSDRVDRVMYTLGDRARYVVVTDHHWVGGSVPTIASTLIDLTGITASPASGDLSVAAEGCRHPNNPGCLVPVGDGTGEEICAASAAYCTLGPELADGQITDICKSLPGNQIKTQVCAGWSAAEEVITSMVCADLHQLCQGTLGRLGSDDCVVGGICTTWDDVVDLVEGELEELPPPPPNDPGDAVNLVFELWATIQDAFWTVADFFLDLVMDNYPGPSMCFPGICVPSATPVAGAAL